MAKSTWFLFDAYGTLLDVEPAVGRGPADRELIAVWRAKQLEYSWTLQAMGKYRDFWTLTGEALDYATATYGASEAAGGQLRAWYLHLEPFPEVPEVLRALGAAGHGLAVLSNGTAQMLAAVFDEAGLSSSFDEVISVDEIGIYKPDPRVYWHALDRLGVDSSQVRFVSSNAWDAAGARAIGLDAIWINRRGRPGEYGITGVAGQTNDLRGLLSAQ